MVRWIATTMLALLLTVSSAQAAEPNAALDELKERCRIYAAEVFAKDYGDDHLKIEGKDIYYNYQAHYNAHLNKCFFLEIASIFEKKNDMAFVPRDQPAVVLGFEGQVGAVHTVHLVHSTSWYSWYIRKRRCQLEWN